jgi:hypothetical protein
LSIAYLEAIQSLLKHIERSIRSMDLEFSFSFQCADPKVNISRIQVDTDRIVSSPGQPVKIYLGVLIDAEEIVLPKMYFSPPVFGPEFISLDNWKIYRPLLIAHILGSLEVNISFDITQTSEGVSIVFFLGIGES